MKIVFALVAAAALAGCVSQTSVETRIVTDSVMADARRRAELRTQLASEYYQRGNFVVALEETRIAEKSDPSYAQTYNVRGLVYMELREDAQARTAFERALALAPNDPDIMNNFGWFLCLRGEPERGMTFFRRVQSDPLYTTPEKALLNAGLCARINGNNVDAEDYLRRAVTFRPDLAGALYSLSEILFEKGNLKEAEIYLNRYMRLGEPTLSGLVLGVRIARALGDKAAEDSMLQQLRRRFPDAPQTRDLLKGVPGK